MERGTGEVGLVYALMTGGWGRVVWYDPNGNAKNRYMYTSKDDLTDLKRLTFHQATLRISFQDPRFDREDTRSAKVLLKRWAKPSAWELSR